MLVHTSDAVHHQNAGPMELFHYENFEIVFLFYKLDNCLNALLLLLLGLGDNTDPFFTVTKRLGLGEWGWGRTAHQGKNKFCCEVFFCAYGSAKMTCEFAPGPTKCLRGLGA